MNYLTAYAAAKGWVLKANNIMVEGSRDVRLLCLARDKELSRTGVDLLKDLSILETGAGSSGGTFNLINEFNTLHNMVSTFLSADGVGMRYRCFALVDNDRAGRQAVKDLYYINKSIIEFRDIFRLHPVLPEIMNLDSKTLRRTFETANQDCSSLDWELEDYLPESFWASFIEEECDNVKPLSRSAAGKIHRDLDESQKGRFHQYLRTYANHDDLSEIINMIKMMRICLKMDRPKI